MPQKKLKKLYELGKKNIADTIITIVCNVDGLTSEFENYSHDSVESEFMTVEQFDLILTSFRSLGFETNAYFDEDIFIKEYLSGEFYTFPGKKNYIINSAQKGVAIGRKSLIPAFCDLHHLCHNNSDAYTVSLSRNKFHLYCLLTQLGFPRPESWIYDFSKGGWLNNEKPERGRKLIAKLNYETSSIGLGRNNIFIMGDDSSEYLELLSKSYKQEVIVQDFIEGYEVEVPVILSKEKFAIDAMCIVRNQTPWIGDQILDYDIRKYHEYEYVSFDTINYEVSNKIKRTAEKIAILLNISGLGRIDFRVDKNSNIFITDIATNPGISKYTATYNAFQQLGFSYEEMLCAFVGMMHEKYS